MFFGDRAHFLKTFLNLLRFYLSGMARLVVGVWVSEKKWRGLSERGVFDSDTEIEFRWFGDDKQKIVPSIILSKFSDFSQLPSLPNVPHFVDPDTQRITTDRIALAEKLISAGIPTPRFKVLSRGEEKFPGFDFILKTRLACGPSWTHQMVLGGGCVNMIELTDLLRSRGVPEKEDLMAQEIISGPGWFYKVFSIGGEVGIFKRKGLGEKSGEISVFDSQSDSFKSEDVSPIDPVDREQLISLAHKIDEILKLKLLGFDVVKGSTSGGTGNFYVIDVNYFPTFKEVPDLGKKLRNLLKSFIA